MKLMLAHSCARFEDIGNVLIHDCWLLGCQLANRLKKYGVFLRAQDVKKHRGKPALKDQLKASFDIEFVIRDRGDYSPEFLYAAIHVF